MSAGVYALPAGGEDPQSPHREDELYYVTRGRAKFFAGAEHREVAAGSLIFVAAGVAHRFYDITEDLQLLVFFAPAEVA
jgi:mannose-6-phosphate isomerase-like protein (cupin superfamily)